MPKTEPLTARAIETQAGALIIVLEDRRIRIPWEKCSPILAKATKTQRLHAELSPGGYGIHWPDVDEDLSIDGLIGVKHACPLAETTL